MAGLTLNKKTIDKYFSYFNKLDKDSKQKLIKKLERSLESEKKSSNNINHLFGAWEDDKTSDEII